MTPFPHTSRLTCLILLFSVCCLWPASPGITQEAEAPEGLQAVLRVQTQRGGIRSQPVILKGRSATNLEFQLLNTESTSSIALNNVQELRIHEPTGFAAMDEALTAGDHDAAAQALAETVQALVIYTGVRGNNAGELIGRAVQTFLAREDSEAALAGLKIAGYESDSAKPGTDFALMQALLQTARGDLETARRLIGDDAETASEPEAAEPSDGGDTVDTAASEATEPEPSIAGVPLRELLEIARGRLLLAEEQPEQALGHFARVQVLSIPADAWYAPALFYSGLCYLELPPPAPGASAQVPEPADQILQQMQRLFPESPWTARLQKEIAERG